MAQACIRLRYTSVILALLMFAYGICEGKKVANRMLQDDDIDYEDLLTVLNKLAELSPEKYSSILTSAGEFAAAGEGCNALATPPVCMALPADFPVVAQCTAAAVKPPEIDCAYYNSYVQQLDIPVDPKTFLASQTWAPSRDTCPQCFDKLEALWCGLALPPCGTVDALTRMTLVPALTGIAQASAYNQTYIFVAWQEAFATTVHALTQSMTCRESCEELVSSCGCSAASQATFGSVLTYAQEVGLIERAAWPLSYRIIWNRTVCSLLPSRNDPGFTGTCTATTASATSTAGSTAGGGSACPSPDSWCTAPAGAVSGGGGGSEGSGDGEQAEAVGDKVVKAALAVVVAKLAKDAPDLLQIELEVAVLIQTDPDLRRQLDDLLRSNTEQVSAGSAKATLIQPENQEQQQLQQPQDRPKGQAAESAQQQPLHQQAGSNSGSKGSNEGMAAGLTVLACLAAAALTVVGVMYFRSRMRSAGLAPQPQGGSFALLASEEPEI